MGQGKVTYDRRGIKDAPTLDALFDPNEAWMFEDDFFWFADQADDERWTVTNATAGTATLVAGDGGILRLDSASTTADQGVQLQSDTAFVRLATGKNVWLEGRLKFDEAQTCQFFFGLAVADTTIMASGANSTADHIGFEMNATTIAADANGVYAYIEDTGSRTDVGSGSAVKDIVDDTWYRFAIHVAGNGTVKFYVDDEQVGESTPSTLPTDVDMAISIVCQTEGTQDPIVDVDWVRLVADRSSPTPTIS